MNMDTMRVGFWASAIRCVKNRIDLIRIGLIDRWESKISIASRVYKYLNLLAHSAKLVVSGVI